MTVIHCSEFFVGRVRFIIEYRAPVVSGMIAIDSYAIGEAMAALAGQRFCLN